MKLINRLTIDELAKLIAKYNISNLTSKSDRGAVWYRIPDELIVNPGVYSEQEIIPYYEDKAEDYDLWVSNRSISKILTKHCEITSQIYCDLFVIGITDTDDRPKCSNCGCELEFSGQIRSGYGGCHEWTESDHHFCSKECSFEFRKGRGNYPKLDSFRDSGGVFNLLYSDPDRCESIGLKNPVNQIECQRSKFKSQGKESDECYFYITRIGDKLKFGITADVYDRISSYRRSGSDVTDLRILEYGCRSYIADLEAEIKLKFNSNIEYIDVSEESKLMQYLEESKSELMSSSTTIERISE